MRNSRRLFPAAALCGLSLALTACGAKKEADASGLNWAHFPASTAYGGPLGRLELLRQGFETDFDKVRICVETGKSSIADDELLFETKLAYAAWLNASGGYTETDWDRFEFASAANCGEHDASFGGFVKLLSLAEAAQSASSSAHFATMHAKCTANGGWKSCGSTGVTIGYGGPGGLMSWYFGSNPNKWTKLQSASPSTTWLSPYVTWVSLEDDITRSGVAGLSQASKASLIATYRRLKGDSNVTLADLTGLMKDLEGAKLTTSEDPVFKQLAQVFYNGASSAIEQDYKGERGAFSTILHEVGHQYGMDHADHPGEDSVTGQSGTAKQGADGQWVTDQSVMAYALPYLYLTADDVAGARADKQAVVQFLAGHK